MLWRGCGGCGSPVPLVLLVRQQVQCLNQGHKEWICMTGN